MALFVAFAFALAAMAPVIAIAVLVLAGSPRWRALGLRVLVFALLGGVGGFLLWFAGYRQAPGIEQYPALIAFGAGFSAGGIIAFLWCAARGALSAPR
jgi:hypothetical protein